MPAPRFPTALDSFPRLPETSDSQRIPSHARCPTNPAKLSVANPFELPGSHILPCPQPSFLTCPCAALPDPASCGLAPAVSGTYCACRFVAKLHQQPLSRVVRTRKRQSRLRGCKHVETRSPGPAACPMRSILPAARRAQQGCPCSSLLRSLPQPRQLKQHGISWCCRLCPSTATCVHKKRAIACTL